MNIYIQVAKFIITEKNNDLKSDLFAVQVMRVCVYYYIQSVLKENNLLTKELEDIQVGLLTQDDVETYGNYNLLAGYPSNVIWLSPELFKIRPCDEIEAGICHEIGHLLNKDNNINVCSDCRQEKELKADLWSKYLIKSYLPLIRDLLKPINEHQGSTVLNQISMKGQDHPSWYQRLKNLWCNNLDYDAYLTKRDNLVILRRNITTD